MVKKNDTWLPKYVLVAEHSMMPRVLAGNDTLEGVRGTRRRSGWDDRPDIRIYEMRE